MEKKTAVALGAVLALTACSGGQTALPDADFFVSSGQTFLARVGDTAGVTTNFAIVLVRFNGVAEDSRCPENVTCVQAGHATVALTAQTTLALQDVQLEVPPEGGAQIEVADEIRIDVIEVRPTAQAGVTIDFVNYQVVMSVTATNSPFP